MACNCRGAGSSKTIFGQPRSIVAAAAEQRLLLPLREGRMCSVAVVVSGGGCDDDTVVVVLLARVLPLSAGAAVRSFQRHFWFR